TTALLRWQALFKQLTDLLLNLRHVVSHKTIRQTAGKTLLAAGQAPDERTVAGVVLLKPRFLFDHLWTVQAKTRFLGHQQIAAQPGGNRHPAKAAHAAGH